MLTMFLGEKSEVYLDFNTLSGRKRTKIQLLINVLMTVNIGLRKVYLAFESLGL